MSKMSAFWTVVSSITGQTVTSSSDSQESEAIEVSEEQQSEELQSTSEELYTPEEPSEEMESVADETDVSEEQQSEGEESTSEEQLSEELQSYPDETNASEEQPLYSEEPSSEEQQSEELQSYPDETNASEEQPLYSEEPSSEEQQSEELQSFSDEAESEDPQGAPAPSKKELNKQKNVEEGARTFGSDGAKFAEVKGADKLNDRQKTIFNEKLQKAIEKDPRAKKGTMTEKELKALAQKAAAVTEKLSQTKLGKKVNELSLKSESLKDNIVDLQNKGWKIKVGKRGGGSYTNSASKTITIDPSESTKDIVMGLAHETGHAEYTAPADPSVSDPSPDLAKGLDYIRKVVENALLDEGQAQITACKAAKELEAKGETGLNIPGGHSAEYKAVYDKIVDGTYSMDQGRKEMAKIMGSETTSNSGENYIDYYSKAPRKAWNKAHPTAQVPATTRVTVFN